MEESQKLSQRFLKIRETRDSLENEVKEMAAAGRSRVASMDTARMELTCLSEQKMLHTRFVTKKVSSL